RVRVRGDVRGDLRVQRLRAGAVGAVHAVAGRAGDRRPGEPDLVGSGGGGHEVRGTGCGGHGDLDGALQLLEAVRGGREGARGQVDARDQGRRGRVGQRDDERVQGVGAGVEVHALGEVRVEPRGADGGDGARRLVDGHERVGGDVVAV